MSSSLGARVAKSAAWMVAARLALRSIGLVSTVFLARLLRPEDFGLVALATALVGTLEMLGNFSFDLALIREGRATREHYDTVWTLTIIRGAVVAGMLAALAGPAASFFGDPRVEAIVYCLAAVTFLDGLQNVGVVDFRKELQFDREFSFQVLAKLVAFAITLVFAITWREYWALVLGITAGKITNLVLSYAMHPYRPRLALTEWRGLIGFSKWLLAANVSNFVSGRLDTFAIGRIIGANAVGLYEISSEIANLPTGELIWPIQRALFPGYAKLMGDRTKLAQGYVRGLAVMIMIAMPAAVGIACVARLLIEVFLGSQWLAALPLLQVLAIGGILKVGYANAFTVLLSLGRAKLLAHLSTFNLMVFGVLVVFGTVYRGPSGAAVASVVTSAIMLTLYVAITVRVLAIGPHALIANIWRSAAAALLMAACIYLLIFAWPVSESAVSKAIELLLAITLGASVYVSAHLGLWKLSGAPDSAEREVLSAVAPLRANLRPSFWLGT